MCAPGLSPDLLKIIAKGALINAGHEPSGQWEHLGRLAFHLRRRLSESEQELVGDVVDIRGSWEAKKRLDAVARWTPKDWFE